VLNFVFWILVALNALVFAYGRGYLGNVSGNEHEPARVKNQLATDKIRVVPPAAAQAAVASTGEGAPASAGTPQAEAPAPAASAAPAAPIVAKEALVACTEVGSFGANEARRFETRLARLNLGEHQSRSAIQAQDVTSYLVFVPPQASKEAADRKVAELRGLGVENLFIMSADSPYKWAISLGVFKSEASAQAMVTSLAKQGVHGARVAPRGPQATRYVYQFRDIDAATRTRIAGYADRFDAAQVTTCR
jgi:pyruvate/2-oxoglutarate dehydrogenase complex dihydrolipoamide acyltransferase (E2) component